MEVNEQHLQTIRRAYRIAVRDLRACYNPDGLLENDYLAGWMDSILKKDKVFYLNGIYYEGLRACEELKNELGAGRDAMEFRFAADRLAGRLRDVFWNGTYFTDWIRGRRRGESSIRSTRPGRSFLFTISPASQTTTGP